MLMRFALIALLFVSVPLYAAPSGEEPEAAPGSPAAESASPPPGLDGVVFKDEGDGALPPGLEQIKSFRMKLGGEWQSEGSVRDESTALIVNPFSVRKRGKIYGSIYEYHRNDNFDARNYFDPVGKPLPEFKRNQFGVSLGASVTSRLKVFGSYDGLRVIRGSTLLSLVPTNAMKRGDFSAVTGRQLVDPFTGEPFAGNRIPQERIHPVASRLLGLFPDPNRDDPVRNYVNNQPSVENRDTISSRIDYEWSPQTKIFGTYEISDGVRRLVSALPAFGNEVDEREQDVAIDLSHSFSSNKVLSLKVGFKRFSSLQTSDQAYQEGLLDSIGIAGVGVIDPMDEGYPEMQILGYSGIGSGTGGGFASPSPESFNQNSYSFSAGYTYVSGAHTLSLGGSLNFDQYNDMKTWGTRRGQFGFSGQFTGDAFADFLLGIPYTAARGVGSDRADLRKRSWRLYLNDSWKLSPNITLTMGLTYSYSPLFHSIHDNVSFFHPLVLEAPLDGEVVVTGSDRARQLGLHLKPGHAAYDDKNDWQPSFGVAYSPFGNNRLVLRASYSVGHGSMNPFQALTYIGRNYPFFYVQKAESPVRPDLDIADPFKSAALPALSFTAADPELRNPFMQNREVALQYEFLGNWSMELKYSGRITTSFYRVVPGNVPLPAPAGEPIQPRRPNPNYGSFEILKSDATFTNNELNARVTRRLTDFFSLQADFSWGRAISDAYSWTFANPNNPRDLAAERSLWGFFPTKTFNLNYILDLPLGKDRLLSTRWAGKLGVLFEGWRISGITNIKSGTPFSPEIFGDPNNDGVWGDRPDRIGEGNLPKSKRSIDKWFETADFRIPDYGGPEGRWFGNAGRNILLSPGSTQWDISVMKRTPVTRSGNLLELRVQFFNAFNHVNFKQPGNFINSPTFGVISGAGNAREIEIALKYSF